MWSMGVNQSSEGTAKVRTLINLHLMTGQIGKPGCGPFSLTGQPNAMGGRETGGLCHILPGYRSVKNPQHRAELEEFWGLKPGQISPYPGRTAWEIIRGLETGDVKFLWITATNPVVSLPDLERVKAALMRSTSGAASLTPFTVYQEAYYPTETTAYAHVLLPSAQWGEKTGTMTNSERMVTLCQAFCHPPGEAKADWEIFAEVGRRLGFADKFSFQTSAEVYAEYVQLTKGRVCDVSGISHERLKQEGPLQWPCPEQGSGEGNSPKRLYTDLRFSTPDGRAQFAAYHSRGLAEPPDPNYPLVLTTGRLYGHWHTQTRTGRIPKIQQMHPNPFIEIHPRDAKALGIKDQSWVEVRSRRGKSRFPAKVTKAIAPGTVFVPIHWGALWADNAEANALTHPESCPESHQPELKACAVQLVPIKSHSSIANDLLQPSQSSILTASPSV
jgi:ferredoxin-nitrate reductase